MHNKIEVPEYEIRDFYEVHKAQYKGRPYVEVRNYCENQLKLQKQYAEEKLVAYKIKKKQSIEYNEELLLRLSEELVTIKREARPRKFKARKM